MWGPQGAGTAPKPLEDSPEPALPSASSQLPGCGSVPSLLHSHGFTSTPCLGKKEKKEVCRRAGLGVHGTGSVGSPQTHGGCRISLLAS